MKAWVYNVKVRTTIAAEETGLPGDLRLEVFLPAFVFDRKVSHSGLSKAATRAVDGLVALRTEKGFQEVPRKAWEPAMVHEEEREVEPGAVPGWHDNVKELLLQGEERVLRDVIERARVALHEFSPARALDALNEVTPRG